MLAFRGKAMYLGAAATVAAIISIVLVINNGTKPFPDSAEAEQVRLASAKARVLYVDSYHEGYPWSEDITKGILDVMKIARRDDGVFDDSGSPVAFRVCRMDTKRRSSEQFKAQAGRQVRQIIDEWKPDVVICADDNASRYVIVPYFRDGDIPFVFCGVNWDASAYGFPCSNVTGMIEVSLIPNLLKTLRAYARGPRVGLLGADNESNRKEAANYVSKLGVQLDEVVFVETFEQWKAGFLELQQQVDMLILAPPSFLAADLGDQRDRDEARAFVLANTRIPTGSVEDWISPYSLVCLAKLGSEQGEWAAGAARRILSGTSPTDIPVATNQHARVYLNMVLAKRLGVIFPVEMIEQAVLVSEDNR